MPFVGAIISPHSPLLLPTVGKEYQSQTKRTRKALATAVGELHALNPDVIIVVHPHGPKSNSAIALNMAPELTADFSDFGDMVTTRTFDSDSTVASAIKEQAEDSGLPITLTYSPSLAYDAAIPLLGLPETVARRRIQPMATAQLSGEAHVNTGRMMADVLHESKRRIAVVISAELSQHATDAAPGGLRPEGPLFDAAVVKHLHRKDLDRQLLDLPAATVAQAEACGYLPLLVLAGLIARKNCHARKLSYEHPFGIGMLVATIQPA